MTTTSINKPEGAEHSQVEGIVIDNCIVSKFMGNGVRITPISLEK